MNQEYIRLFLLKLGFRVYQKGFWYWEYALRIYEQGYRIMNLYVDVAKEFKTTVSKVERAMRYSLEYVEKNIQEYYNYDGTINNKTFLNLYLLNKGEIEHAN